MVAGANPTLLQKAIYDTLQCTALRPFRPTLAITPLCGKCIQGVGYYSAVQAETQRCERGHWLSKEELSGGVAISAELRRVNWLWTPRQSEFTAGGGGGSGGNGWTERGATLRTLSLSAEETDAARLAEFNRVRGMFYRFLREDQVRSLELQRVVFLDNATLEERFSRCFEKLLGRYLLVGGGGRGSSAADRHLHEEEEARKEWRQMVMWRFGAYSDRVSGNGFVNLVAGWHGTREDTMFKIAAANFLEPHELPPEKKKDPGYFGKGIYLTQYPSYSAQYADRESRCLLISWALMGRVYPVVESPVDPQHSLLGKGCTDGYDSHYAVVKQVSPAVYYPCKKHDEPDFDELVRPLSRRPVVSLPSLSLSYICSCTALYCLVRLYHLAVLRTLIRPSLRAPAGRSCSARTRSFPATLSTTASGQLRRLQEALRSSAGASVRRRL